MLKFQLQISIIKMTSANKNKTGVQQKPGLPVIERRNNKTPLANFEEENKFLKFIEENRINSIANQNSPQYSRVPKFKRSIEKLAMKKLMHINISNEQAILIQKKWRRYIQSKKQKAALVIQQYARQLANKRLAIKAKYVNCLDSIIIIQKAIRSWLSRHNQDLNELEVKYLMRRKIYSNLGIMETETALLNNMNMVQQIRSYLQKYKNKLSSQFEKYWKDYDLKLYKFETTKKDFKDWIIQSDRNGKTFWFNIATLKDSK